MVEYFIGLTFQPSSIHYKKIDSFRKRFDSKYENSKLLQMTLLPPFQIDFKNNDDLNSFEDELREVLEGHLYGLDDLAQIEFTGISFSMGKKGVLSLTPKISPDFLHCQESLHHVLKESGAHFLKAKNNANTVLPIGRFDYADQLEGAIDLAKIEFSTPFVLHGESFYLFEKTPKLWVPKIKLYDFEFKNHFFFVNEL
jgi:hypothetical protein